MLAPNQRKIVKITPPGALIDNANATTTVVDTVGYDYAVINVHFGVVDIALTALYLQESEEAGANFANISGAKFGTDADDGGSTSSLPNASNTFVSLFVDLRGRKRYLDLVATAGDGTNGVYMTAWAELWRAKDAPRVASEAGYGQRIYV